jgi:hypothetical protein
VCKRFPKSFGYYPSLSVIIETVSVHGFFGIWSTGTPFKALCREVKPSFEFPPRNIETKVPQRLSAQRKEIAHEVLNAIQKLNLESL